MFVVVENSWRCWQLHHDPIANFLSCFVPVFLASYNSFALYSQMPASGYGGFNFPDLSMSDQHNGFQPRLLQTANFSSGINGSALHSEIRQLSAQLVVVERDLAVEIESISLFTCIYALIWPAERSMRRCRFNLLIRQQSQHLGLSLVLALYLPWRLFSAASLNMTIWINL